MASSTASTVCRLGFPSDTAGPLRTGLFPLAQGFWAVEFTVDGAECPPEARLRSLARLRRLAGDPCWYDRAELSAVGHLPRFPRSVDSVLETFEPVREINLSWLSAAAVTATSFDWWAVLTVAYWAAKAMDEQANGARFQASQMLALIEGALRAAAA